MAIVSYDANNVNKQIEVRVEQKKRIRVGSGGAVSLLPPLVNNLEATVSGVSALDAAQGSAIKALIEDANAVAADVDEKLEGHEDNFNNPHNVKATQVDVESTAYTNVEQALDLLHRQTQAQLSEDDIRVVVDEAAGNIHNRIDQEVLNLSNEIWNVLDDPSKVGPQGPEGSEGPQGIQGAQGEPGPRGADGTGIHIKGHVETIEELPDSPERDDAWFVTETDPNSLAVWDGNRWVLIPEFQGPQGDIGPEGPQGIRGPKGETGATGPIGPSGATFTPLVDSDGFLSWSNEIGLTNPATQNIRGPRGFQGVKGDVGDEGAVGPMGATFTPSIDDEGNISWTNAHDLPNPPAKNIISIISKVFAITLSVSGWSDGQYTISNIAIPGHTITLETMLTMSLLEADFGGVTAATGAQRMAWVSTGDMSEVSCVDGAYTFEIDGDVPTVDIPVLVEINRATRVSG